MYPTFRLHQPPRSFPLVGMQDATLNIRPLMIALLQWVVWSLRYPRPRSAIEGRIRPLRISLCTKERFGDCMALHERNEEHGVPSDHRERYLSTLGGHDVLTLIATDGDHVVGTFGVQYGAPVNTYCLCYLMVSPERHRQGIGTTMLLAALALLPEDHPELTLCISALPTAADFYYRFGFRRVGEHQHSSGQMHQLAVLPVTSAMSHTCRVWLAAAGAKLPSSTYEIPMEKAD